MPYKQFFATIFLLMKYSVFQLLLIIVFTVYSFANSAYSQSLLNKMVSISVSHTEIKKVIKELEKETGAKFSYSSEVIDVNKKISCSLNNVRLEDFLNNQFKPLHIYFSVLDNEVIMLFAKPTLPLSPIEATLKSTSLMIEANSNGGIVISGTIKDSLGNPLEGVTIKVKKSTIKTVSDKNGHFSIKVEDKNAVLVFTYVGYEALEKSVISSSMDIAMFQTQKKLDDVVVIGYDRAVRKKDLTIAAGKVDMAELQKAPVVSFESALAGRVAGVTVVSPDGQPGAVSTIVIRGNNSVTQDNSPLYVIDGFPIENPDNNMLNPAEIESMEILKDASATAIYVARGANGVILITTKKGKVGTPTIEFQAYRSTQNIAKRIPLMSPYEYVQYQYELNPSGTLQTFLKSAANNLSSIDSIMNQYKQVKGVDLQNDLFGTPAPFINGYLAIRGGNDKTKYNISGNYANQEGIIINSGFKRYQLKINLDQTLN